MQCRRSRHSATQEQRAATVTHTVRRSPRPHLGTHSRQMGIHTGVDLSIKARESSSAMSNHMTHARGSTRSHRSPARRRLGCTRDPGPRDAGARHSEYTGPSIVGLSRMQGRATGKRSVEDTPDDFSGPLEDHLSVRLDLFCSFWAARGMDAGGRRNRLAFRDRTRLSIWR